MKNRWLRQDATLGEWLASVGDESDNTNPGFVLHKFGENDDVNTAANEDVWDAGGDYNWPAAAQTMSVVSANAADAAAGTGARTVQLIGLDANYDYLAETVTLNGVTPVVTTGSFLRLHRMRVLTAGSGEQNAGIITATGSTSSSVHAQINAGNNQTLMAVWTVPAGYTLFLNEVVIGVLRQTAAAVDFTLRVRPENEVFTPRVVLPLNSQGQSGFAYTYVEPLVISEKSDVIVRVGTSANNTAVTADFEGEVIRNTYLGTFREALNIDG